METERKIIESYYQKNSNGFEFADQEQFVDVATYFGVSRIYIEKLQQELSIANDKLKKIGEYINTITEEITMLKQDGYDMYDIKDLKGDIKQIKKIIKGGNDSK